MGKGTDDAADLADLRDMFATAALTRLADRPDWRAVEKDGGAAFFGRVAADCYALADAMLAARVPGPDALADAMLAARVPGPDALADALNGRR